MRRTPLPAALSTQLLHRGTADCGFSTECAEGGHTLVRILSALVMSLILFVLATPATAAALIGGVMVLPLPAPANCYAGTTGTDNVMFLRAKISQADCDVIGGGSPCLNRREFAADGPNGRPVSLLAAIVLRPSVTGAGDFVGFTEFGFNVCLMATASEDTEGCVGRGVLGVDPHSIAINPAGDLLAITQLDATSFQPTRFINVVNPNTFDLVEPTYQVSTLEPGGNDLRIETVDFTVDGDYLIFDALNTVSGWGIYAVSRSTAATIPLVPSVAGLQIRNPSLAQTSDDHMVFDALNTITGTNTVFAANLLTGDLVQVATTSGLSYPSYTGDDRAVVLSVADGAVGSLVSLDIQPLAADRLTPVGARTRWLTDGGVAAVYRRGPWSGTYLGAGSCGDTDSDGVADGTDNCLNVPNLLQEDFDGDGAGYVCDTSCAGSIDFTHTFANGASFSILASDSIEFAGTINSGADITFGAGQRVALKNGTTIMTGADFKTRMQGCTP